MAALWLHTNGTGARWGVSQPLREVAQAGGAANATAEGGRVAGQWTKRLASCRARNGGCQPVMNTPAARAAKWPLPLAARPPPTPPARRPPVGHVGKRRQRAEGWWRSLNAPPPPPQNAHSGGTPAVTLLSLQSRRRGRPPKQCENTGTAARQSLQRATGQKHPSRGCFRLRSWPTVGAARARRPPAGRPRRHWTADLTHVRG